MSAQRYTAVAIVLHWAIALAIAGMIALGWWMGDALEESATQAQAIAAFQLHKSIGLTVLLLSLARLGWRLANPPPPLPAGMKPWERLVASATHWAFYFVIIAMPLTGWLYVSTGWSSHDDRPLEVPTLFFGLFQVPHLFGLAHLAEDARAALSELFENFHSKLAWGAIVLTALHVGAALKHHVLDKDDVLTRMVPGLKPLGGGANVEATPAGRAPALIAGFAAILIAALAALWLFTHPPTGVSAPPAEVMHTHEDSAEHEGEVESHQSELHEHADEHTAIPASPGAPPSWRVERAASSIAFTGAHAGVPFEGRFTRWSADIRFDPAKLDASFAHVTIETASAADGVALHDQTLPGAEWFNAARHPTASFRTTSIHAHDGAYEAHGVLTIKGHAIETELPFTLRIDGDRALMDGTASISRRAADLGMGSDPDAEYVSADIGVRVHVEARRAQ
jgi:cytochrome b561/polyisoprenoid-binding protein YceI